MGTSVTPEPETVDGSADFQIRDPRLMRALAHPARLAILDYFYAGRTGTATDLARVVRLSPSATSYHLRALARWGLVEEAPSRGDGRERVWRSGVRSDLKIDMDSPADAETQDALRRLIAAFLVAENDKALRWVASSGSELPEWIQAAAVGEALLRITVAELAELTEKVLELVRPYTVRRRPDPPPGARIVSVLWRAIPTDAEPGAAVDG